MPTFRLLIDGTVVLPLGQAKGLCVSLSQFDEATGVDIGFEDKSMLEPMLKMEASVSGKLLRGENGDYAPLETIHTTVRHRTE